MKMPGLRTMSPLVLPLFFVAACPLGAAQAQPAEVRDHAAKGLEYAGRGDFEAAERELRQSVEQASKDPRILGALGGVLAKLGKIEESNIYLEQALALDPGDTVTRRNLATNQWRIGRLDAARGNLERVLQAKPGDQQAIFLLGMVAENQHDHARAAKLLESVPGLVRTEPVAITALASAYYHIGDKDKARAALRVISSQPAHAEVVYGAARVALEAKDYEVAERLLSLIRSTYPDPAAVDFDIALAGYHQNRFADSEKILTALVATGRGGGAIYNLLGWCLEKQGKRNEAIDALTKAIEQEPSKESHYLDLAGILATSIKRLPAALAIASQAAQLFPSSYGVWARKGSIETSLQQFQDAARSYTVAVELKPDLAEPRRALALAKWSGGETPEAIEAFEGLIERFPKDALNYEAYGTALFKTASSEEMTVRAARLLEKAISIDPTLAEPHYYLGNLALTQGNTEQALYHLEAGAKLEPQSSKMHFALSRALRRGGRNQQSQQEYEAYTKLKHEEEQAELR